MNGWDNKGGSVWLAQLGDSLVVNNGFTYVFVHS